MRLKLSCQCGQHIEVDSDTGGGEIQCPSCGSTLQVPEIIESSVPPIAPPPPIAAEPAVILSIPPQKQRSIGWGVFWGLFGFFIVLPAVVIGGLMFLGVFGSAFQRAQQRADRINATKATNTRNATNTTTQSQQKAPKTLAELRLGPEFEITKDDIENVSFIKIKDSSRGHSTLYLYVADDGDGDPSLRLKGIYYGSDPLLFTEVIFRANGRTWTVKNRELEFPKTAASGETHYCAIDILLNDEEILNMSAIRALLTDPEFHKVRFQGASDSYDLAINAEELHWMEMVFGVWERLGGH